MGKKISSDFDFMVVDVMACIVTGQSMRLEDGEGSIWTSSCIQDDVGTLITIRRNRKIVVKISYEFASGKEFREIL